MPGLHGGHTPIGVELNKQSQKTSHINVDRFNFKRGILYKSFKNTYIFSVRLTDSGKITNPIPLLGSSEDLVMRYGSPEEMEGQWEVLVMYKGNSINRGVAQIIGELGASVTSSAETVEQSNQLIVKGTAFAPPGAGIG